ncbi:MAG: hypothetical protein D6722_01070 [Bacteroidetes bacterium]|nr:MAG: hypothetical protein D6722_01070 [Bacteroidota bacterium]
MMMNHSLFPWMIAALMGVFVYGLTYHARYQQPAPPSYQFYDTASVTVEIRGSEELHDIYGRYNNIIEGKRQLVKASQLSESRYRLTFEVNSPRPALLYVDDEPQEVFLVPGDTTLHMSLRYVPETFRFDSVTYRGKVANICDYYQDKRQRFGRVSLRAAPHLIATDTFQVYAAKLDSLAARELAFLAEREVFSTLPQWFVSFEKSDILYQKAYLKLSQAYNREVSPELLDQAPLHNAGAVLSYYYYLYIQTYLSQHFPGNPGRPQEQVLQHLAVADTMLRGAPHDVFMTRAIFQQLQRGDSSLARELLDRYEGRFVSQKYARFLRTQVMGEPLPG